MESWSLITFLFFKKNWICREVHKEGVYISDLHGFFSKTLG
jgi:hypothetical protein